MKNMKEPKAMSDLIMFYPWGLGGEDGEIRGSWTMKTLGTILRDLGHDNVTIQPVISCVLNFKYGPT